MGLDIERALRRAKSRVARGELAEAAVVYRGILDRFPENRRAREALSKLGRGAEVAVPRDVPAPDLTELRDHVRAGRFAAAEALATGLATAHPASAELHELRSAALVGLGHKEAALAALKQALDLAPDRAPAWSALAGLLAERGEGATALLAYGRAVQLDPALAEAQFGLALGLWQQSRADEALACLGRAVDLQSGNPAALLAMGQALMTVGAIDMAALALHRAMQVDAGSAEAPTLLGDIRAHRRNWAGAVECYEAALQRVPENVRVLTRLAIARRQQGDPRGGLAILEQALALAPDDPAVLVETGIAQQSLGQVEAAVDCLNRALALNADDAAAHIALGNALVALGRPDRAIGHYRRAWALDPADAAGPFYLSGLVPAVELPALAEDLERAEVAGGTEDFRAQIAFARAQADLRLGRDARAMSALERGGSLRKAALRYDPAEAEAQFARIRAAFCAAPTMSHPPLEGPVPIFIVGMPRSGTSLTEQILASHSAVHGAGELEDLRVAILRHSRLGEAPTPAAARAIRADYLAALRDLAPPGASHVVDKMPLNFRWIGHIAAALPEARIVHVRRQAEAVCWSNYRLCFGAEGMAWTYDQRDVARYWKLYDGLMAHWRALLPGRMIELCYEQLTEDQEGQSRRLLSDLGLPWEDGVLRFHENGRAVRTASRMQVRQKMYRGSSDDWRRYAPWLVPMLTELARP